jgi:hypothetical protein
MNLLIKLYAVSNETFVVVGFISLFLRRNLICFGVALPGFLTGLFFFRASFNFTFSSLSLCHRPSSSFVGLYRFTFDQFIFAIVVCRNVNDVQIYEKFRYDQNKKCLGYVSHSEQVGLSNIPVTYTPVSQFHFIQLHHFHRYQPPHQLHPVQQFPIHTPFQIHT